MPFPVIVAHGALGYWDEIIFISVVVIFVIMMAISWIRSRDADPEESAPVASQPSTPTDTHIELD